MTFTDIFLIFLSEKRSAGELLEALASVPELAGTQLSAEPGHLRLEAPEVVVRVHLLTERADLKKWVKPEAEKARGKVMALRLDFAMEPTYRGERWQFSGALGGSSFEVPLLVVRVRDRFTPGSSEGEGWSLVNIFRWPRFRML